MKLAILVCALAATAVAAPRVARPTKLDPTLGPKVQAAEQAWSAAEAERDPKRQPDLWERAAIAFGEIDAAPVDAKVKRVAARAAILAWKNALDLDPRVLPAVPRRSGDEQPQPQPLPAREQKVVAAFDRYVAYADPSDPELPGVLYLKANLYGRFEQLDLAIPIFRSLIDRYPRHDVAGYAANLLLDSYNRLRRYDQLVALADELAKDAAFLRDREDLARTVALVQRQGKRQRVEDLEKAARASKDWDMYIAAASAYLDLYNADREARDNDEVLYNAGVLFEQGRAIGQALQVYGLIEKSYPRSRLAARATARTARLYSDIAMYEQAAEKLEQYAKRYAGEKDASAALSDAAFYRSALGDRARAIEDTRLFIRMYGRKQPAEAASASWSLTALYEPEPEATIKHLQEYLRTFGAKGGPARMVIAQAKIGALLWKQSCPHAVIDGLCVKVKARTPACGAGTTGMLIATKRDAKTSERARAGFAAAIKEYERRSGAFDDPAARHAYAQAKLALADAELEAYLALAFPRGLSFDPAKQQTREGSLKRFTAWLAAKRELDEAASRKYAAVLAIKDPASAITAASRLGTIAQTLASELVTAAIPRDLRTGRYAAEKRKAYCDVMTEVAAPLEARAVGAFTGCLAKSTELGWFEDSSAHCERQLFVLKPDEFPRASELRIAPLLASPVIVLEPPVR